MRIRKQFVRSIPTGCTHFPHTVCRCSQRAGHTAGKFERRAQNFGRRAISASISMRKSIDMFFPSTRCPQCVALCGPKILRLESVNLQGLKPRVCPLFRWRLKPPPTNRAATNLQSAWPRIVTNRGLQNPRTDTTNCRESRRANRWVSSCVKKPTGGRGSWVLDGSW